MRVKSASGNCPIEKTGSQTTSSKIKELVEYIKQNKKKREEGPNYSS